MAAVLIAVAAVSIVADMPLVHLWAVGMLGVLAIAKSPLLRATVGVVRRMEWFTSAMTRLAAARGESGWIGRVSAAVVTDFVRAVARVLHVAAATARAAIDALRTHARVSHVALTSRATMRALGSVANIATV